MFDVVKAAFASASQDQVPQGALLEIVPDLSYPLNAFVFALFTYLFIRLTLVLNFWAYMYLSMGLCMNVYLQKTEEDIRSLELELETVVN